MNIIPNVSNNVQTREICQSTQGNCFFHSVTAVMANKTNLKVNKTLNITSSVKMCAWVTSDRFSSAVVVSNINSEVSLTAGTFVFICVTHAVFIHHRIASLLHCMLAVQKHQGKYASTSLPHSPHPRPKGSSVTVTEVTSRAERFKLSLCFRWL